ncbi:DUF2125 domain-containing protein [Pseudogemmobacter sp. W21_MBD1_M6]|uniref:DUF2125 domain-containing protein n=1 Tax=Pseudogemmobacter sp. W21_MBD1_M6 TaxID=3240271 RepID=UPI003F97EA73
MRRLMVLVLVAASLWGGYWFVGSTAVERGLATWLAQQQSRGWDVSYSDLSTGGFPNRFDTTLTDVDMTDPVSGLGWRAPFFQIFTLSYKPTHIIAVWPNEQTLITPSESIAVTSDDMRGSAVFKAGPSLALDHSSVVVKNLALTSDAGWELGIADARFATRLTATRKGFHDVALESLSLALPDHVLALLDPDSTLSPVIERLKIDSSLGFDAPWDRFALEGKRPALTEIGVNRFNLTWGMIDIGAQGVLTVDSAGILTGKLDVSAKNWRKLLEVAVAAGLIPRETAPTVVNAMTILASMSGDPDVLDVPLAFQNGMVSFGPIPLGPAPRLTPF